jgi:hypothetical protein
VIVLPELDKMSESELGNKYNELKELLEEVIEERGMILGQRNLHLSSKLVTKYANEIDEIKGKIKTVEKLLGEFQSVN